MLVGKIISISDIRVNVYRLEDVEIKIGDVLRSEVGDKEYEFEVAEINGNEIICVALKLVIGLSKGVDVFKKNDGLEVEYSEKILGRVFNAYGEPIDGKPVDSIQTKSIDSKSLKLDEISINNEI